MGVPSPTPVYSVLVCVVFVSAYVPNLFRHGVAFGRNAVFILALRPTFPQSRPPPFHALYIPRSCSEAMSDLEYDWRQLCWLRPSPLPSPDSFWWWWMTGAHGLCNCPFRPDALRPCPEQWAVPQYAPSVADVPWPRIAAPLPAAVPRAFDAEPDCAVQ